MALSKKSPVSPLLHARAAGAPADWADAIVSELPELCTTKQTRSEERRVGKECHVVCRSRWSPYH